MPDEPPPPPPSDDPSSTDLPPNVAATIACIPLVGGIVFYILEKKNSFVRFYAMQSIVLGVAWLLLAIACGILGSLFGAVPGIGDDLRNIWNLIAKLINLAVFVLMLISMVKAFTGSRWEIPYIGPMARKQVGES